MRINYGVETGGYMVFGSTVGYASYNICPPEIRMYLV